MELFPRDSIETDAAPFRCQPASWRADRADALSELGGCAEVSEHFGVNFAEAVSAIGLRGHGH